MGGPVRGPLPDSRRCIGAPARPLTAPERISLRPPEMHLARRVLRIPCVSVISRRLIGLMLAADDWVHSLELSKLALAADGSVDTRVL